MKSKTTSYYFVLAVSILPSAFIWRSSSSSCQAFAPTSLTARTAHRTFVALPSYPRPRPNRRRIPLYYRDREVDEEQFTNTLKPSNDDDDAIQPIPTTTDVITLDGSNGHSRQPKKKTGFSTNLIRTICFSQASMLFLTSMVAAGMLLLAGNPVDLSMLHWNGGVGAGGVAHPFTSFWDFSLTPIRLLQGVLATIPMIALGTLVENSERRDASHVNFSTTNMVVSLFGRRHPSSKRQQQQQRVVEQQQQQQNPSTTTTTTSTWTVLILSLMVALFTGVTEEIVFRGYLPTAIWSQAHHSVALALLGQATIFGLGHVHKNSSPIENRLVAGLQFVNGLWQGMVYLMTGGDLLPCMVAHVLYDMHVFVETWKQINDQMDWTGAAITKNIPDHEEREIRLLQKDIGSEHLSDDTLAFCRRFFYAFDYERKGSLSLRDVQRAISYAFLRDKIVPTEEQVRQAFDMVVQNRVIMNNNNKASSSTSSSTEQQQQQRLRLPDFLKLLFAFKTQALSQQNATM